MRRRAGILFVGVALLAACGRGSKDAATTTTIAVPSTATTTTTLATSPEDQVRAAWDAYWSMIVRLEQAPVPDDAELPMRTTEPLLGFIRDQFATQSSLGQRVTIPDGAKYVHRLEHVTVQGNAASVEGCQLDDSVTVGPGGEVVDGSVTTKRIDGVFALVDGTWKASSMKVTVINQGLVGCGA